SRDGARPSSTEGSFRTSSSAMRWAAWRPADSRDVRRDACAACAMCFSLATGLARSVNWPTRRSPAVSRRRVLSNDSRHPVEENMAPSDRVLTRWFDEHRAFLWGLSYRITGSTADADDVLQETFLRAWQHAPEQLDNARRWLTGVAGNASRDVLRRRKRRSYIGPWLPVPIDTSSEDVPPSYEPVVEGQTLEGRYDLMESASLAFLQALEGLTPTQRAVLLLCDVFDYSAGEVGAVLDGSEGNVRQIHRRARRAMESYDPHRALPTAANRARTGQALERFLALLADGDVRGVEQM